MKKERGFTIVEMMLSMTILALLLTALAASINASMINFKENEGSYKTVNNARLALSRMCSELRTSQGVMVLENFNYCTFINSDGDQIQYWYRTSNKTLYLIKDSKFYVLCDSVESLTFTKGLDPDDPGKVRNIQITMTVKSGDSTTKLSTAAVVMRNMP